jgi:hypothetical protein
MNYAVAFDVELDRLVPESWNSTNPPLITCAAVHSDEEGTKLFYTKSFEGKAPRLGLGDASALLDELWEHSSRGALIISWGGTAVDFRALHFALYGDPERQSKCATLVQNHIDVPIASATDMGIMFGLDAAAQGTGQGRKSNVISTDAPRMWNEGEHDAVLEHVKLDAVLTLKVYKAMMSSMPPKITWRTRSGKPKTWMCFFVADMGRQIIRLCTVAECMLRPKRSVPFKLPVGMDRDSSVQWIFDALQENKK